MSILIMYVLALVAPSVIDIQETSMNVERKEPSFISIEDNWHRCIFEEVKLKDE